MDVESYSHYEQSQIIHSQDLPLPKREFSLQIHRKKINKIFNQARIRNNKIQSFKCYNKRQEDHPNKL